MPGIATAPVRVSNHLGKGRGNKVWVDHNVEKAITRNSVSRGNDFLGTIMASRSWALCAMSASYARAISKRCHCQVAGIQSSDDLKSRHTGHALFDNLTGDLVNPGRASGTYAAAQDL
jgi:hypothetical protein